jgi:hypothetical protein
VKIKTVAIGLVAVIVAMTAISLRDSSPARAAYPAAEGLNISQQCTSPTTVGATLSWTTFGGGEQWVDLSYYNNSWAPGSYVSAGPLPYYQSAFAGDGLTPGATYYARINTLIGGVWYGSSTFSFVALPDCSIQAVFVPIHVVVPVPPMLPPIPPPVLNPLPPQPIQPLPQPPLQPLPSPTPPPMVNPLPY